MFDGMGADLRYVLRVLRRSPGFCLVAVLSLAVGIGANVSMFGVVRTLLLRPLPVEAPEELKLVTWRRDGDFSISQIGSTNYEDPATGISYRSNLSYPGYQALREASPDGASLFAFAFVRGVSVAFADQPPFLAGGTLADGRYFSSLRIPMALGRPLTEADDVAGGPVTAVLSHAFWMRAFGGDSDVIGRTVRVNGTPAEVVGVTGEGFRGLSMGGFFPQTDVTVPLASQPVVYPGLHSGGSLFASEDVFWLRVMARVRGDVALAATERGLEAALRSVPSPLVGGDGHVPEVRLLDGSQGAQPVRSATGRLLLFLLGVVGLVLLIACVNLASMMLARGVARARDMAVRRALGGARARLVRQTLLESLVLAAAGVTLGVVLSYGTRGLLGDLLTSSLGSGAFGDLVMNVDVDGTLVLFSVVLGTVATLLSGLLPAIRLSGLDPARWLQHKATGGASHLTLGRVLIAVQIAVSVPLVVGTVLFLKTAANLGAVDLGFDPRGLVTFQVNPGYTNLEETEYGDLYLRVVAGIEEIPGVRSVTIMENVLMSGIVSNGTLEVNGTRHNLFRNAIGPAFVETLGVELLAGRMPGLQDDRESPRIGVVNQTAVERIYGGSSPVGQLIGSPDNQVRIVGVVSDTPYRNRREAVPPTLFESALQRNGYGGHEIVVRSDVPPARLEPLIRQVVYQIDPDVPVPTIRSQTDIIAQSSARERVFTQLLTAFGIFALFLASIGLHGVTAYSVARRTSEIGLRVWRGPRPGARSRSSSGYGVGGDAVKADARQEEREDPEGREELGEHPLPCAGLGNDIGLAPDRRDGHVRIDLVHDLTDQGLEPRRGHVGANDDLVSSVAVPLQSRFEQGRRHRVAAVPVGRITHHTHDTDLVVG